jgi:hypothetical protein
MEFDGKLDRAVLLHQPVEIVLIESLPRECGSPFQDPWRDIGVRLGANGGNGQLEFFLPDFNEHYRPEMVRDRMPEIRICEIPNHLSGIRQ